MTDPVYVQNFLDAMYQTGVIEHSTTEYDGGVQHISTFYRDRREVELVACVENDAYSYAVIGRSYTLDHGCDEEIELLATTDPDAALARFEEAVDSLTS